MKSLDVLFEEILNPSTKPNTMAFYHGGNLDSAYNETIAHKKGRYEYGPGLYLTTHHGTAQKYSKGSRKLYLLTIAKGLDLSDALIDQADVLKFINTYVIPKLRKEIIERLDKRVKNGKIPADMLNNLVINLEAIKPSNTDKLRQFYLDQGIDYNMVSNAFGWGEKVMVLFNMKKIVDKTIVGPKDKIEGWDLPIKWN